MTNITIVYSGVAGHFKLELKDHIKRGPEYFLLAGAPTHGSCLHHLES